MQPESLHWFQDGYQPGQIPIVCDAHRTKHLSTLLLIGSMHFAQWGLGMIDRGIERAESDPKYGIVSEG